jgi:hypothetical protein
LIEPANAIDQHLLGGKGQFSTAKLTWQVFPTSCV